MTTTVDWQLSDRITVTVIEGELFAEYPRVLVTCDGDTMAEGGAPASRLEPFLDALDDLAKRTEKPDDEPPPPLEVKPSGDAWEVFRHGKSIGALHNLRIVGLLKELAERGS
jgi:hypothetical protein